MKKKQPKNSKNSYKTQRAEESNLKNINKYIALNKCLVISKLA